MAKEQQSGSEDRARDAGTERLARETAEPMTNPAMRWESSRNGEPARAEDGDSAARSADDSETDATPS